MTLSELIVMVKGQLSLTAIVFGVLFIVSEVLGANERIRAGSLYEILKVVVNAVKYHAFPIGKGKP